MSITRFFNPLHYYKYALVKLYQTPLNQVRSQILERQLNSTEVNRKIAELLRSDEPALVGRMGGVETNACWHYARNAFLFPSRQSRYRPNLIRNASVNAGIYVPNDQALHRFSSIYLAAVPYMDLAGLSNVFGMTEFLHQIGAPTLDVTSLGNLEPWKAYIAGEIPWSLALGGKKVLVIHPFAQSIKEQYSRKHKIKTISDILPDFQLKTLMPPVTFAGSCNTDPWEDNLRRLTAKVAQIDFDVALIGCGAYGLPLGAFIKQIGRSAIHMGGATQLLFGIRGNRWEGKGFELHASLMDESWVRPHKNERPAGAKQVEDSCYW